MNKKPEVKIIKKTLPTPQWYKDKKIKEQLKTISDIKKFNNNVTAYNALSAKVKPKPKLRLHVDSLKNQKERKEWDKKYSDIYNNDGTLKNITLNKLKKSMSREEYFSRNRKK